MNSSDTTTEGKLLRLAPLSAAAASQKDNQKVTERPPVSPAAHPGLLKLTPSANPVKVVTLPPPSRPKKAPKPLPPKHQSVQVPPPAVKLANAVKEPPKKQPAKAAVSPAVSAASTLLPIRTAALPRKLTVEADFHIEAGKVGLRFYSQTGKSPRQLLTLASLRNAASEAENFGKNSVYSWDESDIRFLVFLLPALRRMDVRRLRANVYMLPAAQFQNWRADYAQEIGRFINRDDQRALPPPGQSAPVGLAFQLSTISSQPDFFRIQAQMVFPDGVRKYVHEVIQGADSDPNAAVSRAELFKTVLPVPWKILDKHFNRPLSVIQRSRIVELLPQLLNQHLELLESGPCVLRRNPKNAPAPEPTILFGSRGNDFFIQCLVAERPLPINATTRNIIRQISLDSKHDRIVIDVAEETGAKVDAAIQILRELAENPNSSEQTQDGIVFPNSPNSAIFLARAWRSIPIDLKKSTVPEFRGIFAERNRISTLLPKLKLHEQQAFVDFEVQWQGEEQQHFKAADVTRALLNREDVIKDTDGHWLAIDHERAAELRDKLVEAGILYPDGTGASLLRSDAQRSLRRLSPAGSKIPVADAESEEFAARLITEPIPELPPLPDYLETLLRDYQKQGVRFLLDRTVCNVGAILADDMGLGKTLQVLSLLETWRAAGISQREDREEELKTGAAPAPRGSLVVCPATVIGVWIEQAKRFCPELPVIAVMGTPAQRQKLFRENPEAVLVTHYGLMRTDFEMFQSRNYEFEILDEAQNIKNPDAMATVVVKGIQARHRLALTGTPLENRLLDLWSVMDYVNHGYLGERGDYISNGNSPALLNFVVHKLAPIMIRRNKSTVAAELPPRTVNIRTIEMTPAQRELYDREKLLARSAVGASGTVEILAALTRLRQICCDPELLLKAPHQMGSGKLELLLEQLADLTENGHSVLVFSQFTTMLSIIQSEMEKRQLPSRMITGDTAVEERARLVEEFNSDPAPSTMLLSLKAAGTGLTLTKADYVFLYDPWWNPAAENQAIDRTHRIGQNRPVFAYRLIAEDSIEERVLKLMETKQALFDKVVGGAVEEAVLSRLGRNELLQLLE